MSLKTKFARNWGQLGMKFNIWEDCPKVPITDLLSSIVDNRGKTVPRSDEGWKLIATNCVTNNTLFPVYEKVRYLTQETYETWFRAHPIPGDILFVNKGTPGRVCMVPDPVDFCIAQDMIALRADDEKIYNKYLFAVLRSREIQQQIYNTNVGDVIPHFKKQFMKQLLIPVPNRKLQERIGDMYYQLSYKTELNKKINKNLEQQAQVIYQQMFIDNASSNWTEGTLSDIADITMGQSPSGSSYNEDGNGTIFFQGRAEFGFRFPTVRLYTTEPKRMACANDTLMSVRAPVGDLNVAHTDCCIGRGLAAIHSKNNHQSFVLYTMFSLKKRLDVFNGEGTVFGSINRNSLNEMPLIIPSSEKLDEFEALVAPMDAAIHNNYNEICRLEQLRDSLLPKLMSGELDVSDIDF